jgi:hypothetical protein
MWTLKKTDRWPKNQHQKDPRSKSCFLYIHTYVLYNTSYNLTRRFKKGPPRCHAPRHARLARIPVRKHRDALSPARARNPRFIAKRPMLGKTGWCALNMVHSISLPVQLVVLVRAAQSYAIEYLPQAECSSVMFMRCGGALWHPGGGSSAFDGVTAGGIAWPKSV